MAEKTLEHETDETDNTSWVDVFNSIDQLLQTINEKQDDGNIAFHEASLILNKLETALSIVVRLTSLDIDLIGPAAVFFFEVVENFLRYRQ